MRTFPSATWALTPAGIEIGCFPIRDMIFDLSLPNRAQQFAAQPLRSGLAIAHDPPAGAEDGDAQTIEDGLKLIAAEVQAASRPAGALDFANDALALRPIL